MDYCDWLGEDDIQGKKFGFLAGNLVYYIGGSPSGPLGPIQPYETIGLTHPFYHDLRSRGTGISYYEADGLGNDFTGWGFWQILCAFWEINNFLREMKYSKLHFHSS